MHAKDAVRSQTALMWAVTENHPDIVKLLVARGADVKAQTTITTPKGQYVPARAGGASGQGIIRQRALPTKDGGMTPLLFAVRDGNVAMTRLLLELGADINQASGNRTSPLLIALLNGQVAMATELLERGANPNIADDYARGALFAAIELRNFNHEKYPFLYDDGRDPLDLIKALLAKGADPNLRTETTPVHGLMQFDGSWANFDGQTPFIRAALSGDIAVMRLLLQHGADPNIATKEGSTALMAACGHQLDSGPDVHPLGSRVRRGREAVPRARRTGERHQLTAAGRHSRRGESRMDVDYPDPRRCRREARCGGRRRPHAVDVCRRHVPRDSTAGGQARGDRAAEEAGREMNRILLASFLAFVVASWAVGRRPAAGIRDSAYEAAPRPSRSGLQSRIPDSGSLLDQYCITCHNDRAEDRRPLT